MRQYHTGINPGKLTREVNGIKFGGLRDFPYDTNHHFPPEVKTNPRGGLVPADAIELRKKLVEQYFEGLRSGEAAKVSAVFAPDAKMWDTNAKPIVGG